MRPARAFTIAETMVVTMILGLMLAAIAAAIGPLFSAPDRAQAKSDSLGPMSGDLYILERDVREGDALATFSCGGTPVQCGEGGGNEATTALALPTALLSGAADAQLQTVHATGQPQWNGFIVYRQHPESMALDRVFVAEPALEADMSASPPDPGTLELLADDAVTAAQWVAPDLAVRGIASLSTWVDRSDGVVSLHVVSAGSANGHANTTTFDDAILPRN